MTEREWLEAQSEALARAGRKKPRKRKMRVTVLPDDPRIKAKRPAKHPLVPRAPMRGDRISESEEPIWLNVGRKIEQAPGKISGKEIA